MDVFISLDRGKGNLNFKLVILFMLLEFTPNLLKLRAIVCKNQAGWRSRFFKILFWYILFIFMHWAFSEILWQNSHTFKFYWQLKFRIMNVGHQKLQIGMVFWMIIKTMSLTVWKSENIHNFFKKIKKNVSTVPKILKIMA